MNNLTEAKENLEKRFEEFLAAHRKKEEALEKRIAALEARKGRYPKRIMRLSELVK